MVIVVDGCPASGAKKMVEHVGINIDNDIVVAEEDVILIEKTSGKFDVTNEDIINIKNLIEQKISK